MLTARDLRRLGAWLRQHFAATVGVTALVLGVVAIAIAPGMNPAERLGLIALVLGIVSMFAWLEDM